MDRCDAKKADFIVNLTYYVFLAFIVWFMLKYAVKAAFPLIFAYIPAAAAQKPSRLLEQRFRRMPPRLVRAAVITVIWLIPIAMTCIAASRLLGELNEFARELPDMLGAMADAITGAAQSGGRLERILPEWLARPFGAAASKLREDSAGFIMAMIERLTGEGSTLSALGSAAMRLPAFAVTTVISVAASYFIGLDMEGLRRSLCELLPARWSEWLRRVKHCGRDTVITLLRTYALLMLLTFSELAGGFAIINFFGAQIRHIIPLSMMIALVDILPVLGVGAVLIPWAAAELIAGNTARCVMIVALYAVVMIVRNFLEPKLVGQNFGVHPAFMLAAMYFGGRYFGIGGVVLLPLTLLISVGLKNGSAQTGEA